MHLTTVDLSLRKYLLTYLLTYLLFGSIASGGARLLRYLARRASDKKRGRDGTKYSKFHPRG